MNTTLAEIVSVPVRWFVKPFSSVGGHAETAETETPQERQHREKFWWLPMWEFVVHAAVGTVLFVVIALVGWLPTLLAKAISPSPLLAFALGLTSNLLLVVDVILFTAFVGRTTYRAVRRMLL